MIHEFTRMEMLIGTKAFERLRSSRVAVFGIGGVGSYVAEALARAGIGYLSLVDNDKVSLTNINRQLIATHRTIGQDKVDVMRDRILDINPEAVVDTHKVFVLPDNAGQMVDSNLDYVVDAIDTVSAKIALIAEAHKASVPIISCMGAGNKLDPGTFKVSDLFRTTHCPLSKVMRRELKKIGIHALQVVYSPDPPLKPVFEPDEETAKRRIPGSISFVPSTAGLLAASEVVRKLIASDH